MDTEDALKAGHCVDPEREMHFWARAGGSADARNASHKVNLIIGFGLVSQPQRADRPRSLCEGVFYRVVRHIAAIEQVFRPSKNVTIRWFTSNLLRRYMDYQCRRTKPEDKTLMNKGPLEIIGRSEKW